VQCCDAASSDDPLAPAVQVVAPREASLGAGLSAALGARGWWPVRRDVVAGTSTAWPVVLVPEDDDGRPLKDVGALTSVPAVCIGSAEVLPGLLGYAERGAVVLHRDAPFALLVMLVEGALREGRAGGRTQDLRARVEEARALRSLTTRESEILTDLMEGLTAGDIAARTFRSLHTVRSHIKTVLAKLGVNSQNAATALAERCGVPLRLHRARAQFTNCGDVPQPGRRRP
jgi:DNA-binding CsgD family transcriptional regulator